MMLSSLLLISVTLQASPRAAIERQYQRLDSVILRNDVPGMLAIQAPSFSSVNPSGAVFDYAAMEDRTRLLASLIRIPIRPQAADACSLASSRRRFNG